MEKRVLVILFLSIFHFAVNTVYAQQHVVGMDVGLNRASFYEPFKPEYIKSLGDILYYDKVERSANRVGIRLGVHYSLLLDSRWSVRAGIGYLQERHHRKHQNITIKVSQNTTRGYTYTQVDQVFDYWEIPLVLQGMVYEKIIRFDLYAGTSLLFLQSAIYKRNVLGPPVPPDDYTDRFYRYNQAAIAGATVSAKCMERWRVQARFQFNRPINQMLRQPSAKTEFWTRSLSGMLGVEYVFSN